MPKQSQPRRPLAPAKKASIKTHIGSIVAARERRCRCRPSPTCAAKLTVGELLRCRTSYWLDCKDEYARLCWLVKRRQEQVLPLPPPPPLIADTG